MDVFEGAVCWEGSVRWNHACGCRHDRSYGRIGDCCAGWRRRWRWHGECWQHWCRERIAGDRRRGFWTPRRVCRGSRVRTRSRVSGTVRVWRVRRHSSCRRCRLRGRAIRSGEPGSHLSVRNLHTVGEHPSRAGVRRARVLFAADHLPARARSCRAPRHAPVPGRTPVLLTAPDPSHSAVCRMVARIPLLSRLEPV